MKKSYVLMVLLLALAGGSGYSLYRSYNKVSLQPGPLLKRGLTLPNLSFKKFQDGRSIVLSDIPGRFHIVYFWDADCDECVEEEIPELIEYREKHKDHHPGLILVALDPPDSDDLKRAQEFLSEKFDQVEIFVDPDQSLRARFGVKIIPTSFLMTSSRTVVGTFVGQQNWLEKDDLIQKLQMWEMNPHAAF